MIIYLDTSAIIPLLIDEPASVACGDVWNTADDVATSHISWVECSAALAAAHRVRRITQVEHHTALASLEDIWTAMAIVPVDEDVIVEAASLSDSQALRGYDAVHCASALAVSDVDMVAAAGDRRLLAAWRDLGLATVDITR